MDTMVRALAHNGRIRIFVCKTTDLVEFARQRHDTYPTATAALGRLLSAGVLMGSMLKSDQEKISMTIRSDGPLKTIIVDADHLGNVRGLVGNPYVNMTNEKTGKLDVGRAVGRGMLNVVKDLNMKNDFTSSVELQTGEIGEDLAYYFLVSEQTPSAVSVGVLVNTDASVLASGALIVQMMPDADEADVRITENMVAHLKPISQMIHEGMTPRDIAIALYDDVEVLDEQPVNFVCSCNKERMARALSTLEVMDLKDMIHEDHGCELTCHFCNTSYAFSEDELRDILSLKGSDHVAHS
ncbi:MAG: Hsp33 family molecular chaperone HslO [Erysipelotrichaceae bacterium]|nr:Hsp33 family molecular chaperone HslO [Erysipelotrichaceae bacterium]MDP3305293.1 Hsp33 family molecular chaperone HslO [Erysipelotrichaceae bacterium]